MGERAILFTKLRVKAKETTLVEIEIWNIILWQDIAISVSFWRGFSLSSIRNSKAVLVYEFNFHFSNYPT